MGDESVHGLLNRMRGANNVHHKHCRLYEKAISSYYYDYYSPCIYSLMSNNLKPDRKDHCVYITKRYWSDVNALQTLCSDMDFGAQQNDTWQEDYSFFVDVVRPIDPLRDVDKDVYEFHK